MKLNIVRSAFFFLLAAMPAVAATSRFNIDCAENGLKPKVEVSVAERVGKLDAQGTELHAAYEALPASIKTRLTETEFLSIAEESDITLFRERLGALFSELKAKPASAIDDTIVAYSKKLLAEKNFSGNEIAARIEGWKQGKSDRWFKLLGDRSLEEARRMYIGEKLGEIAPNSLIGKYVKATGAQSRVMRLPITAGSSQLGPEKLIVAVSASSFDAFKKILDSENYISIVGHNAVIKSPQVYDVWGNKSNVRLPSVGTPLPMLVLKTSEMHRMSRYLDLATSGQFPQWNHELKEPWRISNYCEPGGFSCCTHWIGNVPIGDTLVSEYVFPGGEDYVYSNGRYTVKPKPQVKAELKEWTAQNAKQKLLTSVWKVPGNMQLSEVIGQKAANGRGEFASPGWVIRTLMGPTKSARVPVVFYVVDDHRAAIPDVLNLNYEGER